MKIQSKTGFVALAAVTFVASLAIGALVTRANLSSTELPPNHEGAHASWVSPAESVNELTQEADLIVRVQALRQGEPRYMWSPAPAGAERSDGRSTFVFTDTEVEVLQVYSGNVEVGDRLWVLQTGGDLVTLSGEASRLELSEDPLYQPNDEMVLFLVDISGDPVQAKDRSLFRTVNPNGRFHLEGSLASRSLLGNASEARQDLALRGLEEAINQAVRERNKLGQGS